MPNTFPFTKAFLIEERTQWKVFPFEGLPVTALRCVPPTLAFIERERSEDGGLLHSG